MSIPPDPNPRVTDALAVPMAWQPVSAPNALSPFGYYPQAGTGPEPEPPTPWYLDFGGVFQRHRNTVVLAALFAALTGFVIGSLFRTQYWTIDGRLRYIKPSASEAGKSTYESLSLPTYANLVKADETLDKLAVEFQDKLPRTLPTKFLQRELKVETPLGNELLEVSIDAIDPVLGVALVNRTMQLYVDYTNEMRRGTILTQSVGMLNGNIERNEVQVRKWKRTIDEYRARAVPGTPLDLLDRVEIDTAHAAQRKQLLSLISTQESKLQEMNTQLIVETADLNRELQYLKIDGTTPQSVEQFKSKVFISQEKIKEAKKHLEVQREEYRKLPIDYAEMRILELEVQNKEYASSLKSLVEMNAAPPEAAASNEEWRKLRMRLLGSDNAEFAIIKPAAMPPFATASNRKMLTLAGFVVPMLVVFLALAYYDESSGRRAADAEREGRIIPPTGPVNAGGGSRAESALLSVRIQQWIVNDTVAMQDEPVKNVPDERIEFRAPK